MKTTHAASPFTRSTVHLLCAVQLLTGIVRPALATDLSDIPVAVLNQVAPNIMLTLDNSGSMRFARVPNGAVNYANRPCYTNAVFNKIAYDPNVRYLPGKRPDGSSYPAYSFNGGIVNGFAGAPVDPYDLGYSYATRGIRPQSGGWLDLDPASLKTTGVNLATSFQSAFDINSQTKADIYFIEPPGPAHYHVYSGASPAVPNPSTCYPDSSYTKVIVSATSGPGGTDERQNFTNWFSYYRIKMTMAKTVISQSFATLDGNMRVGFSTINDLNFVPLAAFNDCSSGTCQKQRWYAELLSKTSHGSTPLREAMLRVAEYYRTGQMSDAAPTPDPLTLPACQRNYQIMVTDGAWTDSPLVFPNSDRTVPPLPAPVKKDPLAANGAPLVPGSPFPHPLREGTTPTSDTMSDITMKYWVENLRPGLKSFNVPPTATDPATWPHMSTYGIVFDEKGTLPHDDATYAQLVSGALEWPAPSSDRPTAVDDFWHSMINGHGAYFQTDDGVGFRKALDQALAAITGDSYSGAALAITNPQIAAGSSESVFESTYDPTTWTGNLFKTPINATTGEVSDLVRTWDAQSLLDTTDWTKRNIGSFDGTVGVAFTAAKLGALASSRLDSPTSPGPGDKNAVINFLRGDRSGEGTKYRERAHVLGDIVSAEPVYVGPSRVTYGDAGYSAFSATTKTRPAMVYQAANDGMLHAFDAASGVERWAYVPGRLITANYVAPSVGINDVSRSPLVNLSRLDSFTHLAYVNATPVVSDVDLNNGGLGTPKWISLLVGGLGKGGRGYYALGVTTLPAAKTSTRDTMQSQVMWEFPQNDTAVTVARNVGNSFGKPIIVKTAAKGWVVIVSSGYNNGTDTGGDGLGHVYVLNAATGAVIKDLATSAGSPATPSGLAYLSAYVDSSALNNKTDYVYGGDLLGNLWRFDLSGATIADWNVKLLARLVDPAGVAQPISSAPELAKLDINGDKVYRRMVFVGTGQYLGMSDLPNRAGSNSNATQQQSFYGLVDDQSSTPTITGLRQSALLKQTLTVSTTGAATPMAKAGTATFTYPSKKGWYIDLLNAGERAVSDAAVALGTVSFTTTILGTDPCAPGGSSWLYVLDLRNGGLVQDPKNPTPWSAIFLSNTPSSRQVPIKASGKRFDVIRSNGIGGVAGDKTVTPPVMPKTVAAKRTLWREVIAN